MKNLFLVTGLLLIAVTISFSQTASVTATVNTALSVVKTSDLAIGVVVKGNTKTILSTGAGAAAFTVSGEANQSTNVTVAFPTVLTDAGSNTMAFTGQTPIHNSVNTQGGTAFGALTGGSATLNSTGDLYIWMGGGVTAAANQASGNYSATISVTVAYP